MDSTEYYEKHACEFFDNTVNIDMQEIQDRFLELLPEGGSILDLGCGSGRDSAYFLSQGYDVTALDGSAEMCNLASVHIGQDVLHMQFSEMDFEDVFDGVWACSSLLHIPKNDIEDILYKVINSLKQNGILYMTFRYGDFEGIMDERYFTYYRTRDLKELISKFDQLELVEIKKLDDVRIDRDIPWIHAVVKKIGLDS